MLLLTYNQEFIIALDSEVTDYNINHILQQNHQVLSLQEKTNRMGCINDKSQNVRSRRQQFLSKFSSSSNPIIKISKQWNVETIRQRWHDNELDVIQYKLGEGVDKITRERFLYLLPGLKCLSDLSQSNFYSLFNFEQEDLLTVDNFVTTLIIILKSDDYQLLADMFFFAYSNAPEKDILNQKKFNLFQKQFKEHQLQFLHQTKKPQKNQKGQIFVNRKLFREIFQQYDIKTIKTLFRFNLIEEERSFHKYLASEGINRISEDQVFLIDIKWFLKWKKYMEFKYGIRVHIKDNGKNLDNQKINLTLVQVRQNQKYKQFGRQSTNFDTSQIMQYLEPMNNQRIQGEDPNQLKENLIEFSDFISVPTKVWEYFRIIYGGGPQISKPFPHFYNKRIIFTILDQNKCKFREGVAKAMVYDPKQTFQDIYKKRQDRYVLKDPVSNMVVYYKHPGELEWKKINRLDIKLEDFSFKFKTFIVFVKNNLVPSFEANFNITEYKGKKQIVERIKNYGSLLTFESQGVLQQGHVGIIFQQSVQLYVKNSKGQYLKIEKTCKQLKKLNESILQDQVLQGFAGLENIGNTCYINAPLQCLMKTPYFDEYLNSISLEKNGKDLLTYQLQSLQQQSRKSRDCVSMTNFKKKFDEKFPFFEGSAQHDAQEFLILLLDRLSQEQPRESLGDPKQIKKNKKIHSFFSGKTRAESECLNCHKRGTSEQSFFTYSLSLPIINQTLLNFYLVDKNFKVYKYGITINKDSDVDTVIQKLENQLRSISKNVLIMSVFESEWMNDVSTLDSQYKIAKLEHYDASIVCYPVNSAGAPDYEDMIDQKTKNSVKIQIRNRIFDQKSKSFRSFYFPFFIEVNYKMTGAELRQTIISKIKKFVNQEEYKSFKEIQQQKQAQKSPVQEIISPLKDPKSLGSINTVNQQEDEELHYTKRNSKKTISDLPFNLQYLKNEENIKSMCWFCKKNLKNFGQKVDSKTDCEGCQFPDDIPLYENKIFIKNFKNLVIAIDWKSEIFTKNWTIQETQSLQSAQKQQNERRTNLQKLLKQAENQEQNIELRCEDEKCRFNNAIRKQRIIQAPNILILHLKRFYYKDNTFYKLKNKVVIPQQFALPGFNDKYELYGNVVHYGSGAGRGGHYINYAKVTNRWYRCDDQKVNFTKQPHEHLNPEAYLLFYKRKSMDKSWSFFGY